MNLVTKPKMWINGSFDYDRTHKCFILNILAAIFGQDARGWTSYVEGGKEIASNRRERFGQHTQACVRARLIGSVASRH